MIEQQPALLLRGFSSSKRMKVNFRISRYGSIVAAIFSSSLCHVQTAEDAQRPRLNETLLNPPLLIFQESQGSWIQNPSRVNET